MNSPAPTSVGSTQACGTFTFLKENVGNLLTIRRPITTIQTLVSTAPRNGPSGHSKAIIMGSSESAPPAGAGTPTK